MSSDPLGRFGQLRGPLTTKASGKPFNSGEHVWLGDEGAAKACAELHFDPTLLTSLARSDGTERFSYGELVALSGDFYASPDELFFERPGPVPWLWEDKDLSDLKEMFQVEMGWIRDDAGKTATDYPDQNLRMWWNAKGYLELALANVDHFGWHNMKAYVRHHGEALALAAAAQGQKDGTFRRAVFTNAFADHFLTDGFAAGHVRVPRREICEWATAQGYSDKLAGALSKLLHDQDGHVATMHSQGESGRPETDGLAIRNADGSAWFTRCDGQLFLPKDAEATKAVTIPVRAVAASVHELLVAWKKNELPIGPYAATSLVTFPDPEAPSLVTKFPGNISDAGIADLVKSVAWYTHIPWIGPGLDATNLRALLNDLPSLMARFRQRVASDVGADANLRERLAGGYIDGYRVVG